MPKYRSPGVYVQEINIGPKPIQPVGTSTAAFVGMAATGEELNKPTLVTSWPDFVVKFGRHAPRQPYLATAVQGFFANGGGSCYVVKVKDRATDADYIGIDKGAGRRTGLQSLIEIDDVNIVCIPGVTSKAVQQAIIAHCETMKDRFGILDCAPDADIAAVQAQRNGLVSARGYAALYYPWIKVAIETSESSKLDYVPPSGYLAGLYARTDRERGVHKAPANQPVIGVLDVKQVITKGQQDVLNPLGVNCIRAFPGRGIRVWGDRTIANDALWKYVNVRRLFLFLEESIDKGTQWAVFEPDDTKLWAKLKQCITDFLMVVWKQGMLMGSTAEQAFFIKCDRTTMTQDDINNGRVIVLIGVAPVMPAEFVIFRIVQRINGSEISE